VLIWCLLFLLAEASFGWAFQSFAKKQLPNSCQFILNHHPTWPVNPVRQGIVEPLCSPFAPTISTRDRRVVAILIVSWPWWKVLASEPLLTDQHIFSGGRILSHCIQGYEDSDCSCAWQSASLAGSQFCRIQQRYVMRDANHRTS